MWKIYAYHNCQRVKCTSDIKKVLSANTVGFSQWTASGNKANVWEALTDRMIASSRSHRGLQCPRWLKKKKNGLFVRPFKIWHLQTWRLAVMGRGTEDRRRDGGMERGQNQNKETGWVGSQHLNFKEWHVTILRGTRWAIHTHSTPTHTTSTRLERRNDGWKLLSWTASVIRVSLCIPLQHPHSHTHTPRPGLQRLPSLLLLLPGGWISARLNALMNQ